MNCLGCLLILLIFAGPTIVILIMKMGLSLVLGIVNKIGATGVWLWESFLNLFRSEKKEVVNPWTGDSNFDNGISQDKEIKYHPTEPRPKRYESSDGEYVDYTDVK